jgi:hypothetical protein
VAIVIGALGPVCPALAVDCAAFEAALAEESCEEEGAPDALLCARAAAGNFSAAANPAKPNTVTAQTIRNRRTKLSLHSTLRIQLKAFGLCANAAHSAK